MSTAWSIFPQNSYQSRDTFVGGADTLWALSKEKFVGRSQDQLQSTVSGGGLC